MSALVFVTSNQSKHREVQRLLAGIELRWARLDLARPATEDLAAIARARALEARARLGAPVILENAGLYLWDHGGAPGAAFKRAWRELGEAGFAARYGGGRGVSRVVVAYAPTAREADVRLFEGSIGGALLAAPRGEAGYGWDRLWVPDGYERTLGEMHDSTYVVNMRAVPYLALLDALRPAPSAGVYEAHVTVDLARSRAGEGAPAAAAFRAACAALGVKHIAIELPAGEVPLQPMTASFHRGALLDVQAEVMGLARALVARGFEVTRVKIEAHGRMPGAPETEAEAAAAPRTSYFEYHVKIALPHAAPAAELAALGARLAPLGGHLSRSAHKGPDAAGLAERFVTMRAYGAPRARAEERFAALLAELARLGVAVRSRIREYTVFDTNLDVDRGWL